MGYCVWHARVDFVILFWSRFGWLLFLSFKLCYYKLQVLCWWRQSIVPRLFVPICLLFIVLFIQLLIRELGHLNKLLATRTQLNVIKIIVEHLWSCVEVHKKKRFYTTRGWLPGRGGWKLGRQRCNHPSELACHIFCRENWFFCHPTYYVFRNLPLN